MSDPLSVPCHIPDKVPDSRSSPFPAAAPPPILIEKFFAHSLANLCCTSAHHLLLAVSLQDVVLLYNAILDTKISGDILVTCFQHEQILGHTFTGLLKDVLDGSLRYCKR